MKVKLSIVFMVVVMLFSVTFAEAATKQLVIGYATKSSSSPFWVQVQQGVDQAAKDFGVKVVTLGPPKENDISGQLSVIEDLINRKVNALIIAPCDSVGVGPAVKKANDKKIPVVAVDTEIQGGNVVSFVATNNIAAAEAAAAWMGKKLNGKGNIVLINGMIQQGSGKERYEGFRNYIAKNFPNMKIVTAVPGDWDDQKALKGMEDAIKANPVIDGVFVGWDGAALQAYQALTEAKRKDKTVICGFDCYPQSLKLMKEGKFDADVAQSPVKMGYEAVKAAVDAINGKKVQARIDSGVMLVTPDNVDKFIKDNNVKLPQ